MRSKNEEIKKSWFNHIKLKHEDVSRDEKSREILGGGNTFFTVTHSRDITSRLQDEVREIIESLKPGQEQMWNGYQIVRNSKGQLFVKREANDFVDTGRREDETQTVHSLVAEYLK